MFFELKFLLITINLMLKLIRNNYTQCKEFNLKLKVTKSNLSKSDNAYLIY